MVVVDANVNIMDLLFLQQQQHHSFWLIFVVMLWVILDGGHGVVIHLNSVVCLDVSMSHGQTHAFGRRPSTSVTFHVVSLVTIQLHQQMI